MDPATGLDESPCDVVLQGGRIAAIGRGAAKEWLFTWLETHADCSLSHLAVVDASGLLVTPGLGEWVLQDSGLHAATDLKILTPVATCIPAFRSTCDW